MVALFRTICFFILYSTIKVNGMLYFTPTAFPLCLPGFILGNIFITFTTSFLIFGCGALAWIFTTFPFLSILNPIYFLCMMVGAMKTIQIIAAVILGLVLGPIFYFISPEWSILLGGLVGGTIAYFIGELNVN